MNAQDKNGRTAFDWAQTNAKLKGTGVDAKLIPQKSEKPAGSFVSEEGRFSILTPVVLSESTSPIETNFGRLEQHAYVGGKGNIGFAVIFVDYPEQVETRPSELLDAVKDAEVFQVKGQVISENDVKIGTILDGAWLFRWLIPALSQRWSICCSRW